MQTGRTDRSPFASDLVFAPALIESGQADTAFLRTATIATFRKLKVVFDMEATGMFARESSTYGIVLILFSCSLAGCLTGESTEEVGVTAAPPGPGTTNNPPTITGSPPGEVVVGNTYSFTPNSSDSDGDALTFAIENMPAWATFDSSTGSLSGVAEQGSEGEYGGILISVSDGQASRSLPEFSIVVTQSASGSAMLTWTPPTQNTDGSTLTDLADYKIYYGTAPGSYTDELTVDNPGLSAFMVENLSPDTYYFVATAVNANGVESEYSNMVTKVVN